MAEEKSLNVPSPDSAKGRSGTPPPAPSTAAQLLEQWRVADTLEQRQAVSSLVVSQKDAMLAKVLRRDAAWVDATDVLRLCKEVCYGNDSVARGNRDAFCGDVEKLLRYLADTVDNAKTLMPPLENLIIAVQTAVANVCYGLDEPVSDSAWKVTVAVAKTLFERWNSHYGLRALSVMLYTRPPVEEKDKQLIHKMLRFYDTPSSPTSYLGKCVARTILAAQRLSSEFAASLWPYLPKWLERRLAACTSTPDRALDGKELVLYCKVGIAELNAPSHMQHPTPLRDLLRAFGEVLVERQKIRALCELPVDDLYVVRLYFEEQLDRLDAVELFWAGKGAAPRDPNRHALEYFLKFIVYGFTVDAANRLVAAHLASDFEDIRDCPERYAVQMAELNSSDLQGLLDARVVKRVDKLASFLDCDNISAYRRMVGNTKESLDTRKIQDILGLDAFNALTHPTVFIARYPTIERDNVASDASSVLNRENFRIDDEDCWIHATTLVGAQGILENGIDLRYCWPYKDFGKNAAFYLHPRAQLADAVEWAKRAVATSSRAIPSPNCVLLVFKFDPNDEAINCGHPYLNFVGADDEWKLCVSCSRNRQRRVTSAPQIRADHSGFVHGPMATAAFDETGARLWHMPRQKMNVNGRMLWQLAVKQEDVADAVRGTLAALYMFSVSTDDGQEQVV